MSVVGVVKRANAKGRPEESVALRLAVLVAVVTATSATLAQGVGGPPLKVASTAGIVAGFAYSHRARLREGYGLKAFLAVGVVVAFADFLSATSGVGPAALNELQIPLAELFLWVQVLHSMDVPARRDLLFSLVSSLVLMAVAGVLSVSSSLGPFLLVWAGAAMASLVLAHRSEVAERPHLEVDRGPSATGDSPASGRSPIRPAAGLAALVAVVALAVFLVLPAAGAGRAIAFPARLPGNLPVPNPGGLANPSLGGADPASPDGARSSTGSGASTTGYFGFSDRMDTGLRGRPDDTLVMRVRADRPDFWRGQTFDTWDGRVWRQRDQRVRPTGGDLPIELAGAAEDRAAGSGGRDFVQTVYVEEAGPNLLFAAYAPKRVYFSDRRVFEMSDGTIRTAVHLPEESVYTIVSRRAPVTEDLLRASGGGQMGADDPALVARYTQLPDDVPGRVRDLADRLFAESVNRYDYVRSIERWMAANTSYTLDIPPLPAGADAVEQFLFVDRQGFCEQIASSLVVLLRAQGIPARLTVGYAPGQRNPFTGMWEVRARDAHAWAEVWFPGVGWQAFDPTASVPLAGDPYSSSAATGLASYLRSLLPDLPDGARPVVTALLVALVPAGALAWLVTAAVARRRRLAARPWSDVALERLERLGARRGRSRRPWETAGSYADVLARSVLPDERVRVVAATIESDAFSPDGGGAERRDEALRLLRELEATPS